jgi:hypothetical protein
LKYSELEGENESGNRIAQLVNKSNQSKEHTKKTKNGSICDCDDAEA